MSVTATVANSSATKSRRRHTPGGATLGKESSREAQRVAAAILEVLAGMRTPGQAAEALGLSQARYFQLETRAMHALVESCESRPRGRVRGVDQELATLRRQHERVQRDLARQQALVRLAQRSIGLAAPAPVPPAKKGGKKRRRPVVRALRAVEQLQRQSKEAPPAAVTPEVSENMV